MVELVTQNWARILAVVLVAVATADYWLPLVRNIKLPAWGKSEPVTDDAADFLALKRLRERFVRAKCKDGLAAVDVCTAHFFHEGTDAH